MAMKTLEHDTLQKSLVEGGYVFVSDAVGVRRIHKIESRFPKLLSNVILAPAIGSIGFCKKPIWHLLWCFKQLNIDRKKHGGFQLLREIQQDIIAYCYPVIISKLMISRRMHSEPILAAFEPMTIHALFQSTVHQLREDIEPDPANSPREAWIKSNIDIEALVQEHGPALKAHIAERLAQPILLCNNTSQILEIAHTGKKKQNKCVIQ